jgi:TPR repeat protein
MYEKGKGVSRDYSEAAKWYRQAADQGHSDAKIRLEECLKKQNPIKYWFDRLKS